MSDTDDHEFTIEDHQKTKHQSNTNRLRPMQSKDVAWQRNEDERLLKDAGVDADMTEEERKEILEALRQSLPGEKLHQRIISIVGDGPKMQTVDQEQSSNIDVTIEDNDSIDDSTSFLNNARTRIPKRKIISDMEDKRLLELEEMQKRKKIASHKDHTEGEIDIFIRESVEFDDRDSSRSLQSRALKNQTQAQLIHHHSNSLSLTAMCEKADKAEEPCQSSQDLFAENSQREERADTNRLSLISLRHHSHDKIIVDSESEDAVDTLEMVDDEFEIQPPEGSSCSPINGIQEMDENKMQEKSGEGEEGKESNEDCNSSDNVDQATQVENQTIDTQNADRICDPHSSELKSHEQDKNEKVDLSPLPYDDRFIWSQAQTYRLLERKYRGRKQSPLGNTYFCPSSNLNPANYTTVIMQLIDIYLTRFTHFQDSLENYLPWGKPVHVGRHQLKTIDIKKRNEQFEVGDSFISGQFKTERFVVDHNLPSTSTAFREEDVEKSSISKVVGDQENSPIRSRKTINSKESDDFGEKMSGISEDMNAENDQTSNDAAWNLGNRIRSGLRTKKERAVSEKSPALTQPVRHSARINLNTNQNSNSFVEDSSNNSDLQVNMCDERVTPLRTSSRTLKSNNKTEKNLGLPNLFQTPDGGDMDSNLINRKRKNKKNDDEESDVHSLSAEEGANVVHSKKIKDASSSANINFSCQVFYSDSKSEFLPTVHSMPVTPSRSLLMEHSLHKTSNRNYSATDSLRSGSPIEDEVVIKSKVATPLRTRRFFDTGSRTISSVHSAEESDIANECSTATHAQTAGDFQERRTRKRTQSVDERAQSIARSPIGSALPKKAALAEAQEKLVSCPLCNKAFSQDTIEEHASSCQDDDIVASDDEVERQQNTHQRCLRDYRIPRKTVTVERVQQNAKQLGSSDDSDRDNDSTDPDFVLTKDDNRTVQEDDDEKQFSSPVKSFRRISETTNSQLNYQNQFHRKRDSRRGRSKK